MHVLWLCVALTACRGYECSKSAPGVHLFNKLLVHASTLCGCIGVVVGRRGEGMAGCPPSSPGLNVYRAIVHVSKFILGCGIVMPQVPDVWCTACVPQGSSNSSSTNTYTLVVPWPPAWDAAAALLGLSEASLASQAPCAAHIYLAVVLHSLLPTHLCVVGQH